MSQELKVKSVRIENISALTKAVEKIKKRGHNVELVKDGLCRLWNGRTKKCAYVLKLKDGRFDIGFSEEKDKKGTFYTMGFDDWDGEVAKVAGRVIEGINYAGGHVCNKLGSKFTQEELTLASVNQLTQDYSSELFKQTAQSHGYTMTQTGDEEEENLTLEFAV